MAGARARHRAFGPGVVYLLGSLGPNDLIAHSLAGATYGYGLLWAAALAYLLHYAIAEATSRYVLSTGESIVEGLGRLGRPVVFLLAAAIFMRRHLNNLLKVVLIGSAIHLLLPLPFASSRVVWSAAGLAGAFWLMWRGGYAGVERLSRAGAAVLAGSLIIVVLLARPDPTAVLRGLVPSAPDDAGLYSVALLLMAMAGTTVGSLNHLKYPAYVYERGWRSADQLAAQRADLLVSVIGQFILAALIQIAAAATIHAQGATLRTVEDLSAVFGSQLGAVGRLALGIGLVAASFMSYIESNTGYSLIVADAYERFASRKTARTAEERTVRRNRAYRALIVFFCLSPAYVLFTSWEPVGLGLLSSVSSFALAPLLLAGMLVLTNDRRLKRGRVGRWGSTAAIALAIAASFYLGYEGLAELASKAGGR